jgi:hypothetical protein
VQNALVQACLRGAPSMAVVTTNITRLTMDVGEILLGSDLDHLAAAWHRAAHTWPRSPPSWSVPWPARAMFEAAGIASLALPVGLALRALAICGPRTSVIRRATPTVNTP